jgi:hypothetical protein
LNTLSQTHWVARAGFVLSLTFALMAVYYATTQQRTPGRLLKAKDVRLWIRGGNRQSEASRIVPSFEDIFTRLVHNVNASLAQYSEQARARNFRLPTSTGIEGWADLGFRWILGREYDFRPSDPGDYVPDLSKIRDFKRDIIYHYFTPSVASVITISAPQIFLSSSLAMLLIALTIYFGFLWTRNLDQNAGPNNSRSIFIIYIIGLVVPVLVYSISQLFQDDEKRSEQRIVEGYLNEYVSSHPEAVTRWGIDAQPIDGVLRLHRGHEILRSRTPRFHNHKNKQLMNEGSPLLYVQAWIVPHNERRTASSSEVLECEKSLLISLA